MRKRTISWLLTTMLALPLAVGCGGDDPVGEPTVDVVDGDGTGGSDDAGTGDDASSGTDDGADVPDVAPPRQPEITCSYLTVAGAVEFDPDARVVFTDADEHPQYTGKPGFQLDFQADTSEVAAGTLVELQLNDDLLTAEVGDDGRARFDEVLVPEGVSVAALAVENAAGVARCDGIEIEVRTGQCDVSLVPLATDGGCVTTDADPATPEVEIDFLVTNTNGKCSEATLEWDIGLGPQTVSGTLEGGTTSLRIVLAPPVDDVSLTVKAMVASGFEGQANETQTQTLTVDFLAPFLALTPFLSTEIGGNADADTEAPGVQVDVGGSVEGLTAADVNSITCTSSIGEVQLATPNGLGDWTTRFTFEDSATYTVECIATGTCLASAPVETPELTVSAASPVLTIVSPADNATLLAAGDGDNTTTLVYETTFEVAVEDPDPTFDLTVSCRRDAFGTTFTTAGTAVDLTAEEDGVYSVPVALDVAALDREVVCRVSYVSINAATPVQVGLLVALPAPRLTIADPPPITDLANAWATNDATVSVSGSASALTGQPLSVSVSDANGAQLWSTTWPAGSFTGLGFAVDVHLTSTGEAPGTDNATTTLDDGVYTIALSATDDLGNPACSSPGSACVTTVRLDTVAPEVTVVSPDNLTIDPDVTPDADPDAPGFQTSISVGVSDGGFEAGVSVTLTVEGDIVGTATVVAGGNVVLFENVTLQPGLNALALTATDSAGNSDGVSLTATLLSDAPVLVITDPPGDTSTLAATIDVSVTVTDSDGTPLTPETITLRVDGVDSGVAGVGDDGLFEFQNVNLVGGPNVIVVEATLGTEVGASAPLVVTRKTEVPSVSLATPTPGAPLNTSSTECLAGQSDCILDVVCATVSVDDGSQASLSFTCDNVTTERQGTVAGNQAVFDDVTLPNDTTCTLRCDVVDAGTSQSDGTGDIAIQIDRTPPTLLSYEQPDVDELLFFNDLDTNAEGFQYVARVRAGGLEAGQMLHLAIVAEGQPTIEQTATVNETIPDGSATSIVFPLTTYPSGAVTLTTTVTDAAGNAATALVKVVSIAAGEPAVRIVIPAWVDPEPCSSSTDCDGGTCVSGEGGSLGTCGNAFSIAAHSLSAKMTNIADGVGAARLCSDHPSLSGGTPCGACGAGFFEVVMGDVTGGGATFDLSAQGLAEDVHTFAVEALFTDDTWSCSTEVSKFEDTQRYGLVDLTAPTITTTSVAADTDLSGCVSGLEWPGQTIVSAACTEDGFVNLSVDGASQGSLPVTAGSPVAFDNVTFNEGQRTLTFTCTDGVGNATQPAASQQIELDLTPPTVDFVYPVSGPVLAGDSRDVEVTSSEVGGDLVLKSTVSGQLPTQTIPEGGVLVLPHAEFGILQDGTHNLLATISDACGNSSESVVTNLVVDTEPPTVALLAPDNGSALADGDDSSDEGGYQVEVTLQTAGDASVYEVWVQSECGADYSTCADPAVAASGNATGSPTTHDVSVPVLNATEYARISVWTRDVAGNEVVVSHDISISVSGCVASFSTLPASGRIGSSYCETPNQDCDTVAIDFEARVVGLCLGTTTMNLRQDGNVVATSPIVAGVANFSRTFPHNGNVVLRAEAVNLTGGVIVATPDLNVLTDLHAPAVTLTETVVDGFTTPMSGSTSSWLAKDDQSAASGLQIHLHVNVLEDGHGLAQVSSLVCDGVAVGAGLPIAIPGGLLYDEDLTNVTLPQSDAVVSCVLSVKDGNGNVGTTSFDYSADSVRPAPLVLSAQVDSRRRPAVTLQWTAVGDDGAAGEDLIGYAVRYSRFPITDATWENACNAEDLTANALVPVPQAAGNLETYSVSGPDERTGIPQDCVFVMRADANTGRWYFAARGQDAAGNWSSVGVDSVVEMDELGLRSAMISVLNPSSANFDSGVHRLGDVNGDGFDDFALGRSSSDGICIFYGSNQAVVEDIVADVAAGVGDGFQCLIDPEGDSSGRVEALGDFSGDGIDDIAVAFTGPSQAEREIKVFFGVADGGNLSTTPDLVIRGHLTFPTSATFDAGNFDGVAPNDLVIGSGSQETVFVLPGRSDWVSGTQITLNDAAQQATFAIQSFTMVGAAEGNPPFFGDQVGFVGDVLGDNADAGDGLDDIAVTARFALSKDDRQVVVIPGRASTGAAALGTVSVAHDGTGSEDATSVSLRSQPITDAGFGRHPILAGDFDGDSIPEVVVVHPSSSTDAAKPTIYLFDGAAVRAAQGQNHRIHPTSTLSLPFSGTRMKIANNGVVITGQWDGVDLVGNLNDDPTPPGGHTLAYRDRDANKGGAYVRFNTNNPAGGLPYGTFPWVDVKLDDPFAVGNPQFGYRWVRGIGDFNGDGLVDLVSGTNGSSYAVLVY